MESWCPSLHQGVGLSRGWCQYQTAETGMYLLLIQGSNCSVSSSTCFVPIYFFSVLRSHMYLYRDRCADGKHAAMLQNCPLGSQYMAGLDGRCNIAISKCFQCFASSQAAKTTQNKSRKDLSGTKTDTYVYIYMYIRTYNYRYYTLKGPCL